MAGLPEGLVTNSQTIAGEINSIEHVDIEDIIVLWKGAPSICVYLIRY